MSHSTSTLPSRPRLDVALEAIANGYYVFPCGSNKRPLTTNGWKDASQDPAQIRAWWAVHPGAMPSIAVCDGVAMLDFDTKPAAGLVAEEVYERLGWLDLPDTYEDRTGGGGFHLWYQYPDSEDMMLGIGAGVLGVPGFDLRSNGGYSCIHFDTVPPPRSQLAELPLKYHALLPRYQEHKASAASPAELASYTHTTTPAGWEVLAIIVQRFEDATLAGCGRHDTMLRQSQLVGGYIASGHISVQEATDLVTEYSQRWGGEDQSATGMGGLLLGLLKPLQPGFKVLQPAPIAASAPVSDIEASDEQAAQAHALDPQLGALSTGADGKRYIAALLAAGCTDVALLTGLLLRHANNVGLKLNSTNARRSVLASITTHERVRAKAQDDADKQTQRAQRAAAVGGGALRNGSNSRPESTFGNVVRALSQAPFSGLFWMDSFKRRVMVEQPDGGPAPLSDTLVREVRVQLDVLDLHPSLLDTREAIYACAAEDQRNPIVDYFDAQEWDGVERFETEARALFGAAADADEDAYNARCLMWWMMSAVVRARNPGSKADSMLVLYAADGGEGKTELLRALCPDEGWFNPAPVSQDEKRSIMQLPYFLIHEMAEMPTWKNHVEYMTFIDRRRDTGVRMHGKEMEDIPRQCVFFGNTNEKLYLVDRSSENRRFLTVEVRSGRIDLARVKAVAPQLWAEADAKRAQGVQYWPTQEQQAEVGRRNQNYLSDDSIEDAVMQVVSKSPATDWSSGALVLAVEMVCGHNAHPTGKSIGQAMIRFGWTKVRTATQRGWAWQPSSASKKHAVPPKAPAPITNVPVNHAPPPFRNRTPEVN